MSAIDADLDQALSLAEAAAGIGVVKAATVTDCYIDRIWTQGEQNMELSVLFDETQRVLEFDVENTTPRGEPPSRPAEIEVWARTVVLFNEFVSCLIVDHFVSAKEPTSGDKPGAGERWRSGKYAVVSRILDRLGWEAPYGPGEEPVRRRQSMCRSRSEATRTAVAAADEWILDVSTAAAPVREEIDRDQAVRAIAGEDLAGDPARIPI